MSNLRTLSLKNRGGPNKQTKCIYRGYRSGVHPSAVKLFVFLDSDDAVETWLVCTIRDKQQFNEWKRNNQTKEFKKRNGRAIKLVKHVQSHDVLEGDLEMESNQNRTNIGKSDDDLTAEFMSPWNGWNGNFR